MEDKRIYLEISRDENRLVDQRHANMKIGIRENLDDPISSYKVTRIPIEQINTSCNEMIDMLNVSNTSGNRDEVIEKLKSMGKAFCDILLPAHIKDALNQTQSNYLILRLDDHVVHFPWELICIKHEFLCQQFSMGRIIITRQDIIPNDKRNLAFPLKMGIFANPKGDLRDASVEGYQLYNHMLKQNSQSQIVLPELRSTITPTKLIESMRNYDLIHFAGHAKYNQDDPDHSGWQLSEGMIRAHDIFKMIGGSPLPAMVFSNACQSARTDEWEKKNYRKEGSFGLANAFMLAGTRHYIGTFWDIIDEASSKYALQFYKNLSEGQSIGNAVRNARLDMMEDDQQETCWAGYLLYGDPTITYFPESQKTQNQSVTNKPEKIDGKIEHEIHTLTESKKVKHVRSDKNSKNIEKDNHHNPLKQKQGFKISFLIFFAVLIIVTFLFYIHDRYNQDNWTSKVLTLAVVYDNTSEIIDKHKAKMITGALQMDLLNYPRITLLERMAMDSIIEEINLSISQYADSSRKMQGEIMPADLMVYLDVDKTNGTQVNSDVIIRLFYTQQSKLIQIIIEKIRPESLVSQRKKLSQKIIRKLKELFPLRGIITQIKDNKICLNIGSDVGVSLDQQYKVTNRNILLKVEGVEKERSFVVSEKKNVVLIKGWKVELVDEP